MAIGSRRRRGRCPLIWNLKSHDQSRRSEWHKTCTCPTALAGASWAGTKRRECHPNHSAKYKSTCTLLKIRPTSL